MKINLVKLAGERSWLSQFIYHVMTEHTVNANNWKKVFKIENVATSEVEVKVTVNGVDVPFESFIQQLEEQHNEMLTAQAKKLIEKNFNSLIEKLQKMQEDAVLKLEYDVLPQWEKDRLANKKEE